VAACCWFLDLDLVNCESGAHPGRMLSPDCSSINFNSDHPCVDDMQSSMVWVAIKEYFSWKINASLCNGV
jgi:hypothetical protein